MGNENSTGRDRKEESLQRQAQFYRTKCKELENQKQTAVKEAVEALEEEKRTYKEKYEKLLQKEKQNALLNQHHPRNVAVSEVHQRTSPIYPNLQNYNFPTTSYGLDNRSGPTGTFQPNAIPCPSAPPAASPPQTNPFPRNVMHQTGQINCASCGIHLDGPVFRCARQHPCCPTCRQLLAPCGACGAAITDHRDFEAEARRATTNSNQNNQRQNCPNSKDGCGLSFAPWNLAAHLKECPFNEMTCPVSESNNCHWRGKLNQLKVHFNEVHPEHCVADVAKEMRLLNVDDDAHLMYLVVLGNFHFLVHIRVSARDRLVLMAAQLVGTKMSADKWSYQFHVYNKNAPRRKYQYSAVCHNNQTPVADIFDNFDCAALNTTHAKSFADNGSVAYKFYLKQDHRKGKGERSNYARPNSSSRRE